MPMNSEEVALIRLLEKNEKQGSKAFIRALRSFPEMPGCEAVFKPYGSQGRGFYYVTKEGGEEFKEEEKEGEHDSREQSQD